MKHVNLTIVLSLLVNLVFGQKSSLIDASNSGLVDNDLLSITVDKNGGKWIGTAKHGLIKFNDGFFETLNKENSVTKGDYISPVFTDSKGNVWVSYSGSDTLLVKFDGEKWTAFTSKEVGKSVSSVIAIAEGPDGKIYFGGSFGNGGFSIVHNDSWTHVNKSNSKIPDHTVSDIKIDNNGTVWMATNNGVVKMKGKKITPIFFRNGKYRNVILGIALEGKTVWGATNFGLVKME